MPVGSFPAGFVFMEKRIFDPNHQQLDLSSKIVAGLERISQAFKVLLWEKAKHLGLSPIQIQILIFIAHHKSQYNTVSFLAREFHVTKPTLSDAIRALDQKGLIEKDHSNVDNRSYSIMLSELGRTMVLETQDFADPLALALDRTSLEEREKLFHTLSKLIHQLHQNDILTEQRSCFSCKFYGKQGTAPYCHLLERELKTSDIRLDCVEHEAKH